MKVHLVRQGWSDLDRSGESPWTAEATHIHVLRQALRRELLELMLAYQAGHFKHDVPVGGPTAPESDTPG